MSFRLLPATLLLLVAGALISAKPPDLPVQTAVACAAVQEPETPIDLLIEPVVEKVTCPARTLCDMMIDFVCPQLRLRHLPLMMHCPCCQACSACMEKTLANCREAMTHAAVQPVKHEEPSQTCPHCPAGRRCGEAAETTEQPAQEDAEETPPGEEVLDVMPTEEPAQPCTPRCPYLQRGSCSPEANQSMHPTPLDNFERLMKAGRLYRKAEHCRAAGHFERACRLYERCKELCPGSRIEQLACERLEQLYARKAVDVAPAAEEAEALPMPHEVGSRYDRLQTECLSIVDELRDKASQLLEQGNYLEAAALAEMAYQFSSDCENVFNLLAKAHAILHAPKETEPTEPKAAEEQPAPGCQTTPPDEPMDEAPPDSKVDQPEGEDVEVMPPAEEPAETPESPPGCSDPLVQPPLPPVDPAVVDALEKVLREVGDPTIPKLVIEVDDPAEEEQQDPVSTWPYVPPQTDVPPSLLVDPDEDDLTLEQEEEPATPSPEDEAWEHVAQHLEGMLLGTTDALRQQLCCDVDLSRPTGPRGRINFQIGAVQCTLVCDGWGHRFVAVGLTPKATGDLREVQQAHNDRVSHWIEVMNSGGNSSDDEDTASDDEDDSDLLYYDEPNPL
jgi:hypothetical protein